MHVEVNKNTVKEHFPQALHDQDLSTVLKKTFFDHNTTTPLSDFS